MNINSNVKATFGENSDFTEHNSSFRLIGNGNAQLTVQTPKNKFKTAGTKIIVNGGGTLIIDSEDVLGATIQVDTDKILNLTVNKNQANAGKITMASGKINLTVDAAVTKLNFSDNSESDWGTGEIVVTGFKDKVLSFGSNKNGITSNQIAQINTGAESSYLLWNGQLSSVFEPAPRLAAGDIAFTGLNADGADNLSFVALVDIAAGTNFFITDNEVLTGSGGQFNDLSEGVIKWENTTGDVIPAGTSVVLDSTSNAGILTFSSGTATVETGEINLSSSGDGVFAYQTSTDVYNTGTNSFLAHIVAEEKKSFRNSENQFVGDSVLNAETGLTYGVNAVNISGGSGSPDGGKHDRGVTKGSKEQLLKEINSFENWTLESSNGNLILPLSNESYEITAEAVYVPTLVKLTSTSGSVKEDAGQIPVSIEIINAYPEDSTAVQLVFSGTDSTDFNNFISDTVIFAKGVSTAQSAIIPILNDTEPEGEETFTFTLRNVTGGYQSSIGADSVFTLTVRDADLADFSFVYNELHIDPASDISGDANGDGTRDPKEDEFIELINTGSTAFDLSGYYMTDILEPNLAPRHIFPTGTVVDAGQAIVVFGGGIPTSPTNFGGSVVQTASENNDGVGLDNDGNTFTSKILMD